MSQLLRYLLEEKEDASYRKSSDFSVVTRYKKLSVHLCPVSNCLKHKGTEILLDQAFYEEQHLQQKSESFLLSQVSTSMKLSQTPETKILSSLIVSYHGGTKEKPR